MHCLPQMTEQPKDIEEEEQEREQEEEESEEQEQEQPEDLEPPTT